MSCTNPFRRPHTICQLYVATTVCPKPYPRYARRPPTNQNSACPVANPSRTDDRRLFDLCSQSPSATNRRRQPPQVINRRDGSGTLRNRGRPEQGSRTLTRFFFCGWVCWSILGLVLGFSAVVSPGRVERVWDMSRA